MLPRNFALEAPVAVPPLDHIENLLKSHRDQIDRLLADLEGIKAKARTGLTSPGPGLPDWTKALSRGAGLDGAESLDDLTHPAPDYAGLAKSLMRRL